VRNTLMLKTLTTLLLLLSGSAWGADGAQPTPAGTLIQNQATLEYQPEDQTLPPVVLTSPPVQTTVTAQCSVSVRPDGTLSSPGQTAQVLPGESGLLRYSLINTGNTDTNFALSLNQDAASAFALSGLNIYADLNSSGTVDSGEGPITSLQIKPNLAQALLVSFVAPAAARGASYVNLNAGCPAAEGGASDSNNVALVQVGEPPVLNITKSFDQQTLKPGGEVSVSINASNNGQGASREAFVTDLLNTPDMTDFTFVSGSARTTLGTLEYSADGAVWATSEGTAVRGVRVRVPSLAAGQSVSLTFKLRAPERVLSPRTNVATIQSGGATTEARSTTEVRYNPRIALGPVGNPEATPGGELSASDTQTQPLGFLNRELCFRHTVKNLGDVNDTLSITAEVVKGTATVRLTNLDGAAISPFSLAPGESADFIACVAPTAADPGSPALQVLLTATSAQGGAPNQTVDIITAVSTRLPELLKSVSPAGVVVQGETLTYTLKVTNPLPIALKNVVVTDKLDARLTFVSADSGGTFAAGTVTWTLSSVAPGAVINLTLVTKVNADAPDDTLIDNTFTLVSDELPGALTSNPVQTPVFGGQLGFSKTSSPAEVAIGDTITYTLTVTNPSKVATLKSAEIVDDMPVGIVYVPGSSLLNKEPIPDPKIDGQRHSWIVSNLAPGQQAVVIFKAKVTPNVTSNISNTAIARAISNAGVPLSSNPSTISNRVRALIFEPLGDLVGYVFIDVNRDGTYDEGKDIPMVGARVILANGRSELTDLKGRYHFANLREGPWALRLDPSSVYAQNRRVPQDGGLLGSHTVFVRNLTSSDFPLEPVVGDIGVIRDTTLKMGSFRVHKQVFTTDQPNVYQVQLTLDAAATLDGFTLSDPLPDTATLIDGQNDLKLESLPPGSRAVTYRFRFGGDQKAAVTDPTAQWRY
jgi:uncharacterized repeat protein (TIGR01451 family)